MTTSRLVRRSVAVLAAAGAAAAMTFIPAGGADAAVQGMYVAIGSAGVNYTGTLGGSCDLTVPGSDSAQSAEKDFTHGTRRASVNLDATYTSSDNSADTVRVKGHADSTLTLKKHRKDLQSFDLGVGGTVSIHHSVSGSSCSASGAVLGLTQVAFTEHKKGWFYLTRDTKKPNSVVEFILLNANTGKLVQLDLFEGTQSHAVSRAHLKPGTYEILQTEAGISAGESGIFLKSGARSVRAKLTVTLHGEFKPSRH